MWRRKRRTDRQHEDVSLGRGRRQAGAGEIGIAPEWFYKGNGSMVHAHNEPLLVPAYAEDGGEEAEIAAVYLIGADGAP